MIHCSDVMIGVREVYRIQVKCINQDNINERGRNDEGQENRWI